MWADMANGFTIQNALFYVTDDNEDDVVTADFGCAFRKFYRKTPHIVKKSNVFKIWI